MPTSILEEVLSEVPKKTLWHYTNQKALLGIVKSQSLWATHHQYLNDRTEFTLAQKLIREAVEFKYAISPLAGINESEEKHLKTLIEHLELPFHGTFIFVCSFSEVANDLSQWRAYSRGSPGISIGFSPEVLLKVAKKRNWLLSRCEYNEKRHKQIAGAIADKLVKGQRWESTPADDINKQRERGISILANTSKQLYPYALLLKHEAFSREQEWRLISPATHYSDGSVEFREGKSTLIPYQQFSLIHDEGKLGFDKIMIGPTPDVEESIRSVRSLLEKYKVSRPDGTSTDIEYSEIPFRDW